MKYVIGTTNSHSGDHAYRKPKLVAEQGGKMTIAETSTATTAGLSSSSIYTTTAILATNTNNGACNAITATAVGTGSGVYAESSNPAGYALAGRNTSTSGSGGAAILGESSNASVPGVWGKSPNLGVYGLVTGGGSGVAVYGSASAAATAVMGYSSSTSGWAGYFIGKTYVDGTLAVTGFISKPGGGFLIDHPLDPTNKDLIHSFVESPEMKNIYDGVGVADSNGELRIEMPSYFEALNQDFRYQLTPLGGSAPDLHVKQELNAGSFTIAGAKSGQRLCWQITGNRKDAWAIQNAFEVESEKAAEHKGRYRHPSAFGKPETLGFARPTPTVSPPI